MVVSLGDVGCYSLQFNKVITSGEGGMVLSNDEEVWKRVLMYHDIIAPQHYDIPQSDILWSVNFRMPEVLAAIALVQLEKLDHLISDMQKRKQLIKAGIEGTARAKNISFREITDSGEAAIALVLYMQDPATAKQVVEALNAENIGAGMMYEPDTVDYHVYAHWAQLIEKRSWAAAGAPWSHAQREIEYSRDMCPQSLDYLGRAVHLNISPLLTEEDVEETIDGLDRVLNALV